MTRDATFARKCLRPGSCSWARPRRGWPIFADGVPLPTPLAQGGPHETPVRVPVADHRRLQGVVHLLPKAIAVQSRRLNLSRTIHGCFPTSLSLSNKREDGLQGREGCLPPAERHSSIIKHSTSIMYCPSLPSEGRWRPPFRIGADWFSRNRGSISFPKA